MRKCECDAMITSTNMRKHRETQLHWDKLYEKQRIQDDKLNKIFDLLVTKVPSGRGAALTQNAIGIIGIVSSQSQRPWMWEFNCNSTTTVAHRNGVSYSTINKRKNKQSSRGLQDNIGMVGGAKTQATPRRWRLCDEARAVSGVARDTMEGAMR